MILQPHTWILGIGFTDRDADVNKNEIWFILQVDWEPPVWLVEEKRCDFVAYEWPLTKNYILQRSKWW
jgi:hypothetical protein